MQKIVVGTPITRQYSTEMKSQSTGGSKTNFASRSKLNKDIGVTREQG